MGSGFSGLKKDRYQLQKRVASRVCGASLGLALALAAMTYLWPADEPEGQHVGFIPDKSDAYVAYARIFASVAYTGQLDIRQQVAFKVDPTKTEISYLWAIPRFAFTSLGQQSERALSWTPPVQLDEFEKRTPIEPFGVQLDDHTGGYYFAVEGAYPDADMPSASTYQWASAVAGMTESEPSAGITRLVWPLIVPFHPPIKGFEAHLKLPLAVPPDSIAWRALLMQKEKVLQQLADKNTTRDDFLKVESYHGGDGSAGLVFRSTYYVDQDQSVVLIVEWPGVIEADTPSEEGSVVPH